MLPHCDPFADQADPALYVPREASDRALAELLDCVVRPDRPAVLYAGPGLGKTLLLRMLERELRGALRGVYVPNPVLAPAELCAWTLGCLAAPRWSDPVAVLGAYAEHLAGRGAALVWLVDDANGLPEETARWLGHVLTRARGALRLVVAAVEDEGSKPLSALGPLFRIDALARPMQPDETARYVLGRLGHAHAEQALGARCQALLAVVQEASAGVPRVVNAAFSQLLAARRAEPCERSGPEAGRPR